MWVCAFNSTLFVPLKEALLSCLKKTLLKMFEKTGRVSLVYFCLFSIQASNSRPSNHFKYKRRHYYHATDPKKLFFLPKWSFSSRACSRSRASCWGAAASATQSPTSAVRSSWQTWELFRRAKASSSEGQFQRGPEQFCDQCKRLWITAIFRLWLKNAPEISPRMTIF